MILDRTLTALACMASAAALAQPLATSPAEAEDALPAYTEAAALSDGQMRVGRYTTTVARPATQAADPLGIQARLSFPRQTVRSVGDAVQHTLLRTGWRLVEVDVLAPEAQRLLTMPLPASQRTLGPYRVRTILGVLTGPSWRWHEDPMQRLVWFEPIRPRAAAAAPASDQSPTTPAVPVATQVQAGAPGASSSSWSLESDAEPVAPAPAAAAAVSPTAVEAPPEFPATGESNPLPVH